MSFTVVFEKLIALMSVVATLIGSISFNTNFDRPYDEIRFNINANAPTEDTLPNVVNNVNVWSIEGNPFKDAKANKENNIFDFFIIYHKDSGEFLYFSNKEILVFQLTKEEKNNIIKKWEELDD